MTPQIRTLAVWLAGSIAARQNCIDMSNIEWREKHSETIDALAEFLPSGSGIDSGTKIDLDRSHSERIVLTTSFHHMHNSGVYDGWTDHTVVILPSFTGITVDVRGRNRNDIKDYLSETFYHALSVRIERTEDGTFRAIQS
jgi:hypothetical protein